MVEGQSKAKVDGKTEADGKAKGYKNTDNSTDNITTGTTATGNINPIAPPVKKFYHKQDADAVEEEEFVDSVPVIPPRPLIAPKLPIKPTSTAKKTPVKQSNSYPREDNIFTGLKPELLVNKFYSNALLTTLPTDFIPKVFVNNKEDDNAVIGLQYGKIVKYSINESSSTLDNFLDLSSNNRQFYELVQVQMGTLLAFQDTGIVYKLSPSDGQLKILLRDAIPMGTTRVHLRPEINEIWVIGLRETSILAVNKDKNDVALVKRIPTQFPEAASVSFLDAEDLAVLQRDRTVKIFSLPRFGHAPGLIANIPAVLGGDLVKIVKIPSGIKNKNFNYYATIYSDGKMIIWKFQVNEQGLTETITIPLTLFRIQTAHLSKNFLWLGLNNGKIIVVQVTADFQQIVAEVKSHQTTVNKFIKTDGSGLVSIDSGGQLCLWDENLTVYQQNKNVWERDADWCQYERVSVRICSWNAAAQNPADCIDSIADKWLGSNSQDSSDLIVISLQEIVDLSAKNFINDTAAKQNQNGVLDQWIRFVQKRLPNEYKLVHSAMMVGLGLIVFCRDSVRGVLSSVSNDSVKTGLGGLHGNKGGLVWRTFIHDSPVAFVACHLAAGQAAVSERNTDAATILRTATFSEATASRKDPFAFPTGNAGTRLFDHSVIFFAGDLNYRIELDRAECLQQINAGNYDALEAADQLNVQRGRKELLLSYFKEQRPTFAPTYKYDRGTVERFDSSEKARVPAWCDRILFYSKQTDTATDTVQPKEYNSIPEATLSDHKPIYATFELKCKKTNHLLRSNFLKYQQQKR